MTDREVMQQALEALEDERYVTKYTHIVDAINALRTALEQPEQEPSQWRDMVVVNLVREGINKHKARDLADHFAATPPAAQPEHWDKPSASFNEWWDSNVMPPANPFVEGTAAYWAWAGWQAAQRPWVGLTDEAIWEIHDRCIPPTEGYASPVDFARAIEAKLKEKNT